LLAGSVAGWATAAAAPAGVFADLGVLAAYGTGFLLVALAAGHPDARHLLRRTAPQSGRAAD
jgi:hypothetical protein